MIATFRPLSVCALLVLTGMVGCGEVRQRHPAVGRRVGRLPVVSLTDPVRPPPALSGRVTLINFWGTWCPPCRRELPSLVRLTERLSAEPRFQLIAISCGSGGPDDPDALATATRRFLEGQKLVLDAWSDPDGFTRMAFAEGFGLQAFPTTYLVGPDAAIRHVWTGYQPGDEAQIATAVIGLLKERPAVDPATVPAVPAG